MAKCEFDLHQCLLICFVGVCDAATRIIPTRLILLV